MFVSLQVQGTIVGIRVKEVASWDLSSNDNKLLDHCLPNNEKIGVGLAHVFLSQAIQAQIELLTNSPLMTGQWILVKISNGAFYVSFESKLEQSTTQQMGLSNDAVGIVACLRVLKSLADELEGLWVKHYKNLCEFAAQHTEKEAFSAVIDLPDLKM